MDIFLRIEEVQKAFRPLAKKIEEVSNHVNHFIRENPEVIENLQHYCENMPEIEKKIWQKGADYGWYTNWYTPLSFSDAVMSGKENLDDFMEEQINSDTMKIEEKLSQLYPDREKIISTAFDLHRNNNYIASIPLFIAQSDGICAQNLGSYLFTEKEKRDERVRKIIEELPDEIESIFWMPLITDSQFGASIGKSRKSDKEKAPNRSGIMHGSRKHLDYASEINSLKSISLLAYTAFIFDYKNKA